MFSLTQVLANVRLSLIPGIIADTLWGWHQRARSRHRLAALPDHLLKDIGLSRADAVGESQKPFWRD